MFISGLDFDEIKIEIQNLNAKCEILSEIINKEILYRTFPEELKLPDVTQISSPPKNFLIN